MIYGIIYEYWDSHTGRCAYIGKGVSNRSHEEALKLVVYRHLHSKTPSPFEYVVQDTPNEFEVDILDRLVADRPTETQAVLKPLEKHRARTRRPALNTVRFV